ncbi:hypothetical protein L218DRAFT_615739 [Marasmius fiardii PR-910]|nr:hypothetical protein L218DRAFT_615739 [Marasmius fiardii PR-910]
MVDDKPGLKKRRLQNACDECRRRKIRCDSATAPGGTCSNCLSVRIECTHQMQQKKRGPKIGASKDCRSLINAILSSSKPYVPPEDPEAVKELLTKLANHARSLERQLSELAQATRLWSKSSSINASPAPSNDPSESAAQSEESDVEDSIDSLTHELKNMSFQHLYRRQFGKSSNYMLVQSAMDSRRDVLRDPNFTKAFFTRHKRLEFWEPSSWQSKPHRPEPPLTFPEDDLLCDVVDLYFTKVNPIFPLLHRTTFERLTAEGLHLRNRSFGAVVLAVCAIGARQSNDPRNLSEGTTSEHSLGWRWFSQVPLIRDSFTDPPSLYDLQLLSLCVIYLQTTSTPQAAWTLVGIGIRSAQEMGVHRKPVHSQSTVEEELFKRAFWFLISTDLFFSSFMGRPRATTSDDFDLDLPIECDDEFWENPDPEKAFVQPEGKPSIVSFFTTLLRLLDIVSFAQRTLYAVRKSELWSGMGISGIDWKRKAVMQLDSALNNFVDTIPEHHERLPVKWNPKNPDPVFFQQSAMLHAFYHWVQIQIHRPFIPRPGQEAVLALPSLEICTNAARKIIHTVEVLQSCSHADILTLELAPYIITPLFTSALILLVGIWRQKPGATPIFEPPKDMTDVYLSLQLMQQLESRYSAAGRRSDLLNVVLAIGQLPRHQERPGSFENDGFVPSHVQLVPEGARGHFFSLKRSTRTVDTSDQTSHSLSSVAVASNPSLPPESFPSSQDLPGIFNTNGASQTQADLFIGLPAGGEDFSLFNNDFAFSQYMLQPLNDSTTSNQTWNAPPMSGNMEFTQGDWDSIMASVNDIVENRPF